MSAGPIEVQTGDGSFLVGCVDGTLYCIYKVDGNLRVEIDYWNQIPSNSREAIDAAVKQITDSSPMYRNADSSTLGGQLRWD